MSMYMVLNHQQLLDFANGKAVQGQSVAADGTPVTDDFQALTYLDGLGWTFVSAAGYGPMKEYFLKHA